jgi:hypothetical protein
MHNYNVIQENTTTDIWNSVWVTFGMDAQKIYYKENNMQDQVDNKT